MKLTSTTIHRIAMACLIAGGACALGVEGTMQTGGAVSTGLLVTSFVLLGLSVLLLRWGFAVEAQERRSPYGRIQRDHARSETPAYRSTRRDA